MSKLSFQIESVAGAPKFGAELPALTALLSTAQPSNRARCVLITHILDTAVAYIEAVHTIFPVVRVIAIPYSASPNAIEALRSKGFNVVVPASIPDMFLESESQVVSALEESSVPLLVQEVGGYLSKASDRLSKFPHFLGVVEDTNNGHWLYERSGPHPIPVLSMAQSPLKAVEDSIIGDAVLFSIERILREEFAAICQGLRCAVIGFGKIGRSSAVALKGREAVVSIYDINPAKDMSAKVEGFFPKPLHDLLPESDLVVGCTGQTSIRLVDMPFIKDGAILASASSKAVEFAVADFEHECQVEKFSDVIWRFTQPGGKRFYLLLQGTPVNFRDGSILGTILDMIYCELLLCMREVAAKRAPIGLSKSPPALQDEVAKMWMRYHADDFSKAFDDKCWDYPDSLKLGLPKAP
jgi:S-adenosylhomocysteine hydrolase